MAQDCCKEFFDTDDNFDLRETDIVGMVAWLAEIGNGSDATDHTIRLIPRCSRTAFGSSLGFLLKAKGSSLPRATVSAITGGRSQEKSTQNQRQPERSGAQLVLQGPA
jgi:hypothetical protein